MPGVASWPDYMQNFHSMLVLNLLPADLDDVADRSGSFFLEQDLITARAATPYAGKSPFDPAEVLDNIVTALENYEDRVDDFGFADEWPNALATARSEIGKEARPVPIDVEELDIDDAVDQGARAVENRITPEMLRASGRLAVGYHSANGVRSTGFLFGLSDLERVQADKITDFRDKAVTEAMLVSLRQTAQGNLEKQKMDFEGQALGYRAVMQYSLASASELLRQSLAEISLHGDKVVKHSETGKIRIVAGKEQNDMDIALSVKDTTWNLDLYAYAGNFMAAISGSTYKTAGEASGWERVLSAVSGAASAWPIVGPIIGDAWDWLTGGDDKPPSTQGGTSPL